MDVRIYAVHFTLILTAWKITSCGCSRNLALNRPAASDSLLDAWPQWSASKAVDGNPTQNVWCGSCLHTKANRFESSFLRIDLQEQCTISRVEIYYRVPYTEQCDPNLGSVSSDLKQNYRFKRYRIEVSDSTAVDELSTCYQDTSQPYPLLYQNNTCEGTGTYLRVVQAYTTEYEALPGSLLELCEVEVYGCPIGKYGDNCMEDCNVNCLSGICEPDNGICRHGCIKGKKGDMCDQDCTGQTFGRNCDEVCNCFGGEICDSQTGMCPGGRCSAGWQGVTCSEECNDYYYGQDCLSVCSYHCKDNAICNHVTGFCPTGCSAGYMGDKCDTVCQQGYYGENCAYPCGNCFNASCRSTDGVCLQGCERGYENLQCTKECDDYKHGYGCNQTCGSCRNNAICDKVSGICPNEDCEDGFRGKRCKFACLPHTFGRNCAETCGNCKDDVSCEASTGNCLNGCAAGWLNMLCKTACPSGTYGINCSSQCGQCLDGEPCDKETGVCSTGCEVGYFNLKCEKCLAGKYGWNCTYNCGQCFANNICNHVTGVCPSGCDPGKQGPRCTQDCDGGTYGPNCTENCGMCYEGVHCDKITGHCPSGCIEGKRPPLCSEDCYAGEYGKNCEETCGLCFNNSLCNKRFGECPMGCEAGFLPPLCKTECSGGKYGVNCSHLCGQCSSGQQCNIVTGVCPSTCIPGYRGNKCNQECSSGWWGQNCANRCSANCYQNASCNNENGECTNGCDLGYKGTMCTEECGNGTYGMNCMHNCGQCKNGAKCQNREGTCLAGCADGWSPPYCAERIVQPPPENTGSIAGIVGGLLAAVVLLAFVFIIFIFLKRRRGPQHSTKLQKDSSSLPVVITSTNEKDDRLYVNSSTFENKENYSNMGLTVLAKEGVGDEDNDDDGNATADEMDQMYSNAAAIKLGRTDMSVNELRARVSEKKQNDVFKSEFSNLVTGAVKPHETGKDPKNKAKNRFLTTFPYDHSLVPLSTGEYINANYIDGIETKKFYIATQGPKVSTMGDFWRMVWESNTGKIIMLANVVEMGKKKCEQYWPGKKGKTIEIDQFELILEEERVYGAYSVRVILLKDKEKNKQRKIRHFHFTTWPDHGVPDALQFVNFEHIIQNTQCELKGPTIVHCSAGIGRTGTYIALEELLKRARKHKNVDVFEFVKSMRENRMNMIQTLDQYTILHEALLEAHMLTDTAIAKAEFSQMLTSEMKFNFPKNEQRCRREFQKLLVIRPVTDEPSKEDALSNDNKNKNRTLDVIPLIKYRPYLFSHVASRTSYINAVMLPTLRSQVGIIATQYPTQDTVQDFWCLVHDQDSPNVVILEPNEEKIPLFPDGEESKLFGNIYVQQISEDPSNGINERKINILKKGTDETRQITVLECLNWPWKEKLPSSAALLLKLINRVFEWRDSKMTMYPLTVVCFDGATKCGLFCSLYNTLEYLNEHGEVDVPRSVRQLQIRRPEFLLSIDQYEKVYEAVHEYLEQSCIYANT